MTRVLATIATLALVASAWADCTCAKDKAAGAGWCTDCKEGYVAGVSTKSKRLYDAMQGTTITPADVKKSGCSNCEKALASNGSCDACHVHFAGGKMYKSAAAARLAAGTALNKETPMCGGCKAAVEKNGLAKMCERTAWCDGCKAGFVHGARYDTKEGFESAKSSHALLTKAATAAGKCESCAVAMVTDGECKSCKVSFKNGEVVKAKP